MVGLLYLNTGVGNFPGFSLKLEKCLGLVPHSSTQTDTLLPGIEEKARTLVFSHNGSSLSSSLKKWRLLWQERQSLFCWEDVSLRVGLALHSDHVRSSRWQCGGIHLCIRSNDNHFEGQEFQQDNYGGLWSCCLGYWNQLVISEICVLKRLFS